MRKSLHTLGFAVLLSLPAFAQQERSFEPTPRTRTSSNSFADPATISRLTGNSPEDQSSAASGGRLKSAASIALPVAFGAGVILFVRRRFRQRPISTQHVRPQAPTSEPQEDPISGDIYEDEVSGDEQSKRKRQRMRASRMEWGL
jgi:hypothetical protein